MPGLRASQGASTAHVIVGLLVVSLLLVGALTWQAQALGRSHRAMAERVLQDFAALAAAEFVRRATNELGYYGYQPMIAAARQAHGSTPADLPDRASLAEAEPTARAATLVRRFFRYDTATGELIVADDRATDALRATLAEAPHPTRGRRQAYESIVSVDDDEVEIVVYARPDETTIVGFQVETDVIGTWLATAAQREPLLPPSLADGEVRAEWVRLSVVDPAGHEALDAPVAGFPAGLTTVRRLDDEGDGILRGYTVRTAIDPDAAPFLVIGGLPASRLPVLGSLLVLTASLMGVAMLLLHRERAVSRMRSDFVSRVSHELRTPLTQIRLFAETLLLERTRSGDERRRALETIDRESRRLAGMVENILQFSRGERDRVSLSTRNRPLATLVREIVDALPPHGPGGVTIETDLPLDPRVDVDDDAMRQIVLNLIDNALKYGPAGQTIRIALRVDDAQARLLVDDEGPGVPERDRARIWQPYQRLARDRASGTTGTGIGLSVVRDLAERQHGRAWVESSPSGGARFVVSLPVAPGVATEATGPASVPSPGGLA